METVEEKKIGKYLIKIFPDDSAESPDAWGDESRFVVFEHRQFQVEREGFEPREIFENNMKVKGYFVFQCFAYIHSGVALSVANHNFPDARWDVSSTGYWLVKREKGTWTRKAALKAAEGLCETWNQYLSGDVYGYKVYRITTCDKGHEHEEELDSCWGYFGLDYCISEAMSIVEYQQKEDNKVLPVGAHPALMKITYEQSENVCGNHSD